MPGAGSSTAAAFYKWRQRYGGLAVKEQLNRMKELEYVRELVNGRR